MTTIYQIVEVVEDSKHGYRPYGGALALWLCKDHEIVIAGPAETGKTLAALQKLDTLCWKYPGMQCLIVRKTRISAVTSVLKTYERRVLGAWDAAAKQVDAGKTPVRKHGGESPEFYEYPNGSRVWVGGMDKPEKVLSSEYDVIYANQAEELTLTDWETLATRCTGRAGNMPYPQLIGDANPGPPTHWILARRDDGVLTFIESRHEDNPTLFDPDTGRLLPQGRQTMVILNNLTGVRKQRLRYGKWVQAEGVVYDNWDRAVHLIDPFAIPEDWRRIRAIDFGYTNPFVCQWYAIDEDGRMYLYREIYMSGRTVSEHADEIKRLESGQPRSLWSEMDDAQKDSAWKEHGENIIGTVADHDAEDRATLRKCGIPTTAAKKEVSPGIQAVAERLKVAGDGRPRFFVFNGALVEVDDSLREKKYPICTEQEFDVYEWPEGKDGKPVKEAPIDIHNHGMDAARYAVMHEERPARMKSAKVDFYA